MVKMSLKSKPTMFKTQTKIIKKQTSKLNKTRRKKPKSAYNFSYILSHSGIVTTDYDYETTVPENIRLIQYTPKGNTLTEMDVLYLFNEFKKNPNNKGIIEKPQYFSLNEQKQIFESDLELNVTKPLEKTLNLFLYYDHQNEYPDALFKTFTDNPDKFPVIDRILKEKHDIESYLHMGLYDHANDKKFDLDKLGNMDKLLADLNLNSNKSKINSDKSKENSFPDYILYTAKNKKKKRFTLHEMLVGLSDYYKKIYPGEVVNFVQLGCNVEQKNKKAKKFTMTHAEYLENEKSKRFGLFDNNDFQEIREHNMENQNKNILTIDNVFANIKNGYIMSSNKSDVDFMDISK